jgi:hypothetical protein
MRRRKSGPVVGAERMRVPERRGRLDSRVRGNDMSRVYGATASPFHPSGSAEGRRQPAMIGPQKPSQAGAPSIHGRTAAGATGPSPRGIVGVSTCATAPMLDDFSENTASGIVTRARPIKKIGLGATRNSGIHQESG